MPRLTDYAGATARVSPERGLSLNPKQYAYMVKDDGVYVELHTDSRGRIASMFYRSGAPVSRLDAADLKGLPIGLPDSALHGELNAQTEAARRDREANGAMIRMFDISRYRGEYVARRPFRDRYPLLHMWQGATECERDGWDLDVRRQARDLETGLYIRPAAKNLSRVPVLPLYRGKGAGEQAWRTHVELGGGEGLVACRLDAPLGGRAAKKKIKSVLDLDVVVLEVGKRTALVDWKGNQFTVSAIGKSLQPGEVWEVRADGFYESSVTPRFARLQRPRPDLGGMVVP